MAQRLRCGSAAAGLNFLHGGEDGSSRNKCIATSNKCIATRSTRTLLGISAFGADGLREREFLCV